MTASRWLLLLGSTQGSDERIHAALRELRTLGETTLRAPIQHGPGSRDARRNYFNALVELGFDGDALRRMRFKDSLGNETQIAFADWKRNPSLPAGTFKFVPPKGVDVVGDVCFDVGRIRQSKRLAPRKSMRDCHGFF